jgi:hypothetical protein
MSKEKENSSIDENIFEDEMEKEFLLCDENIIDKLAPKKQLENFEIDVKEVMKSGCNRQIAEYSLMKFNIDTLLKDANMEYIKSKNEIKNEINNRLGVQIDNILKEQNRKDEDIPYNLFYDEILDEIVEEILIKNPKNDIDIIEIKKRLIKLIEEENINFHEFRKVKEEYIKNREPIIEAALRLVKKIVNCKQKNNKNRDNKDDNNKDGEYDNNEDDEYDIFYKEYFKN